MNDKPLITIVTPCYNSERYLEDCILSVKNQTYKNIEHIIVDGGSSDNTIQILKKYQNTYNMKWFSEKDNGMYDAISKGFTIGKGDILAWINSDDKYMPWACEIVSHVFSQSTIQWCTGIPCLYTESGVAHCLPRVIPVYPRRMIEKGYCDGRITGFIQQESTFWSRALWEKNKNVIQKYQYGGDFHLWTEFAKTDNLYTLDSVLSGFRVHSGQKSENLEAYYDEVGQLTSIEMLLKKTRVIDVIRKLASVSTNRLIIRTGSYFNDNE